MPHVRLRSLLRAARGAPALVGRRPARSPSPPRTRAPCRSIASRRRTARCPCASIDGERVVTGFSLAADGSLAFAATDPVTPAEVFVASGDGGGERPLTDMNRPGGTRWRCRGRSASASSARASRSTCWVMKPHGFRAGAAWPALLNIHGGPHAQYGHGFFDEFQVYAGAGYGVVYVEPARQPGLRRGVHARGDRRLGRRRLRRRHGGARPGARPPRLDRRRRGSA